MGNKQDFHNDKVTKEQYQAEQQSREAGFKEEYAGEITPALRPLDLFGTDNPSAKPERKDIGDRLEEAQAEIRQIVPSRTIGYVAIVLAFVSLFIFPAIFGPAAVVLGAYAWIRGNKALGAWPIILGLVALAAYFVLIPLYA